MTEQERNAAAAQPLDEAWWTCRDDYHPRVWFAADPPGDGVAILAPYEMTQPGFEMLNPAACLAGLEGMFPRQAAGLRVCLWDILRSKKDPAATDEQKQRINQMQAAPGKSVAPPALTMR